MNSEIVKIKRRLNINLPARQSAFLWGARKTGKSTYLREQFPQAIYYDLLQSDLYLRLVRQPFILREEIMAMSEQLLAQPIIIDEVQKIPHLLDEVHWLIENTKASFILCGSSARKLKRGAANLLGGRAWRYEFFPLVYPEIPQFNLIKALNNGLIPAHYLVNDSKRSLKAYIQDYITEEVQAEGLTRNLPAFARFMDSLVFSQGELTNFLNIARECGVDSKTVKEYYQILIDTLLGYFVYPFYKANKREAITATPKFYLFDTGVANFLAKRKIEQLKGSEAGKAFEHFILMELIAYRGLNDLDFEINFWRTKTGLEVDFVLAKGEVAVEVKINEQIDKTDLKGLIAFSEDYKPKTIYVVCNEKRMRKIVLDNQQIIWIMPWESFLKKLWRDEIIK